MKPSFAPTTWLRAILLCLFVGLNIQAQESSYRLTWKDEILTISGGELPQAGIEVWYIEAYCRPGSTDRKWEETTIGHTTKLIEAAEDQRSLTLRCTLKDGVTVDHQIRAVKDGVEFRLQAHNPTEKASQAHWAQPCIRVDEFTGLDQRNYLRKSFVFLNGKRTTMPTPRWATQARYVPGQVWAAPGVDRDDVNPRPLHPDRPSNGLIGCFSADDKMILATAWEPYQELFQGVIVCLHSDFRIGGLDPGETKQIRGRIYLLPNDVKQLLKQYQRDFPEHADP